MDVILRHRTVEKAKAGDRVLVTGSLVAVPDVAVIHSDRLTIKPSESAGRPAGRLCVLGSELVSMRAFDGLLSAEK